MMVQNVVVLGGAYGGVHAYKLLAGGLGEDYRVIMIDRNTHTNHLYPFARYAVLPGHEHKAFIPYRGCIQPIKASDPDPPPSPLHLILHAKIIGLNPHEVTIDRTYPELGFDSPVIPYKFAVYALGNHLPASIDFWSGNENSIGKEPSPGKDKGKGGDVKEEYDGTKKEGITWFQRCQERVRESGTILCVGGGPLGIQFATDIKSVYPEKQVTVLHSRHRLLPRFMLELHFEVLKSVEDLGINRILGERLDLTSTLPENAKYNERGQRVVRTEKGREIAADLILLCTGQMLNTELLTAMAPQSVSPKTKLAHVLRTLQLGVIPPASPEPEGQSGSASAVTELDLKQLKLDDEPTEPSSPSQSTSSSDASNISPPKFELVQPGHGRIRLSELPETPFGHIFVVGDCADAFGAIKAGHTAFWQAEVAARNIICLAQRDNISKVATEQNRSAEDKTEENDDGGDFELETYSPGPPAIKVSLGVGRRSVYQFNDMVGRKDTPETDDLDASLTWAFFGILDAKPEDMYQ